MTIKTVTQLQQGVGDGTLALTLDHEGNCLTLVAEEFSSGDSVVLKLSYDDFVVLVADAFELSRKWREGRNA